MNYHSKKNEILRFVLEDIFSRPYYFFKQSGNSHPFFANKNTQLKKTMWAFLFLPEMLGDTPNISVNNFNSFRFLPPLRVHIDLETRHGSNYIKAFEQGLALELKCIANLEQEHNIGFKNHFRNIRSVFEIDKPKMDIQTYWQLVKVFTANFSILQNVSLARANLSKSYCDFKDCPMFSSNICSKFRLLVEPFVDYSHCEFNRFISKQLKKEYKDLKNIQNLIQSSKD